MAKLIEFHAFVVEDGVTVAHYRFVQDKDGFGHPVLWVDGWLSREEAITSMGGGLVLGSSMVDDSELVDNPEAVPGILVPRPGTPEWKLMPLSSRLEDR